MIVTVLAACAELTRLAAMRPPGDGGEPRACARMHRLGATQSRMSRHMKVLREVGLLVDQRDAQRVRHRVDPHLPPYLRALLSAALAEAVMA